MRDDVKAAAPSAYAYPLLIKQLLHTPFLQAPDQEIVYRGQVRMTYTTLRERIARLANGLSQLGARHGSTVAVMDWDSHRYLECYFAVPMMGAVLQTVNVRLSHDEIAYTINHAGAEILFVHTDFLPVVEAIKDQLETVRTFVWIDEEGSEACAHSIPFATEYEAMLAASSRPVRISGLRREHARHDVLHDGHDGPAQGRLFLASSTGPSHDYRDGGAGEPRIRTALSSRRCLHAAHAHVPRARVGHALHRHRAGREAGLSGPLSAGAAGATRARRRRDVLALRQHDSAHDARAVAEAQIRRLRASGRSSLEAGR